MKQKIRKSLGVLSVSVLMLNGIAYFDIETRFLSGTLISADALVDEAFEIENPVISEKEFIPAVPVIQTPSVSPETSPSEETVESEEIDTETQVVSSEEDTGDSVTSEQEFIPAVPKLVEQVKTFVNRNGYEVFHGYEPSRIEAEEHLALVKSVRTDINSRIHTGGASNYRETNYRKKSYASDMKTSAGDASKPKPSPTVTLLQEKKIGYTPNVKDPTSKVRRYSLRQSLVRDGGAAIAFKNAKEQKEQRNALMSEVWEQNRTPWENPNELPTDRDPIQIKNPDYQKEWIDYYEQKRLEREAFEAQLQKELEEEFGPKKTEESSTDTEENSSEEDSSSEEAGGEESSAMSE